MDDHLGGVGEEAPEPSEVAVDALPASPLGLAVAAGRRQRLGVHDLLGRHPAQLRLQAPQQPGHHHPRRRRPVQLRRRLQPEQPPVLMLPLPLKLQAAAISESITKRPTGLRYAEGRRRDHVGRPGGGRAELPRQEARGVLAVVDGSISAGGLEQERLVAAMDGASPFPHDLCTCR